ncbi:MAG: hypothetical protein AAGI22_12955 [Planctomycetota bacterium]
MSPSIPTSPSRPLPALLLTLAVLGGVTLIDSPYKSARPADGPSTPANRSPRDFEVTARLWEDPLGAVASLASEENATTEGDDSSPASTNAPRSTDTLRSFDGLVERIERLFPRGVENGRSLTILPVLIPGGRFAAQAEARRRERYAVLSALGRLDYVPTSGSKLRVLKTYWSRHVDRGTTFTLELEGRASNGDGSFPFYIPYEWHQIQDDIEASPTLETAQGKSHDVVVLWFDTSVFGGQSLYALDRLLVELLALVDPSLIDRVNGAARDESAPIRIAVLGPPNSTILAKLLRQRARSSQPENDDLQARTQTIGRLATALDWGDDQRDELCRSLRAHLDHVRKAPRRTPATDDQALEEIESGRIGRVEEVLDRWLADAPTANCVADLAVALQCCDWRAGGPETQDEFDCAFVEWKLDALARRLAAEPTPSLDRVVHRLSAGLRDLEAELRDGVDPEGGSALKDLELPNKQRIAQLVEQARTDGYLGEAASVATWVREELPRIHSLIATSAPHHHLYDRRLALRINTIALDLIVELGRVRVRADETLIERSIDSLEKWHADSTDTGMQGGLVTKLHRDQLADTSSRSVSALLRLSEVESDWIESAYGDDSIQRSTLYAELGSWESRLACAIAHDSPAAQAVVLRNRLAAEDVIKHQSGGDRSRLIDALSKVLAYELCTQTGILETKGATWRANRVAMALARSLEANGALRMQADATASIRRWLLEDTAGACLAEGARRASILPSIQLYNSRATAWGSSDAADSTNESGKLSLLPIRGITHTILQDEQLLDELVEELEIRGVSTAKRDSIVLLGEWDTVYGRRLLGSAEERFADLGSADDELEIQKRRQRVKTLHYLRGLDGNARDGNQSEESAGASGDGSGQQLSRAYGPSQFDYVRRLIDQLDKHVDEVRGRGSEVQAIGIVGSDVYDVILILQAIRARLPNVITFTTGLDARLAHRNNYKFTRNLVVASSYGLQAKEEVQASIPPFRDAYQTASFVACQLALGGLSDTAEFVKKGSETNRNDPRAKPAAEAWVEQFLSPQIHEIARSGPLYLSLHSATEETRTKPHESRIVPSTPSLAPPVRRVLQMHFLVILLFVLIAVLVPRVRQWRYWLLPRTPQSAAGQSSGDAPVSSDGPRPDGQSNWAWFLAAAGLLTLLVIVALWSAVFADSGHYDREPFVLFEGVSVWPTIFLRVAAVFVAVFSLTYAWKKLEIEGRNLDVIFGLRPSERGVPSRHAPSEEQSFPARCTATLRRAHRALTGAFDHRFTSHGNASEIWREYRGAGTLRARFWRVIGLAVPTTVVIIVIHWIDPWPSAPVRGHAATAWEHWTFYVSSFTTIFVTCAVIDAIRLFLHFVRGISRGDVTWDKGVRKRIAEQYEISPNLAKYIAPIDVIAERSAAVTGLIFFPFLLLTFHVVGRLPVFDHWAWSFSLLVAGLFIFVAALAAAVLLRRNVIRSRRDVIERLEGAIRRAKFDDTVEEKERKTRVERLESVRALVSGMRHGALSPNLSAPILGAFLLPFGGLGTVSLIEWMNGMIS